MRHTFNFYPATVDGTRELLRPELLQVLSHCRILIIGEYRTHSFPLFHDLREVLYNDPHVRIFLRQRHRGNTDSATNVDDERVFGNVIPVKGWTQNCQSLFLLGHPRAHL